MLNGCGYLNTCIQTYTMFNIFVKCFAICMTGTDHPLWGPFNFPIEASQPTARWDTSSRSCGVTGRTSCKVDAYPADRKRCVYRLIGKQSVWIGQLGHLRGTMDNRCQMAINIFENALRYAPA